MVVVVYLICVENANARERWESMLSPYVASFQAAISDVTVVHTQSKIYQFWAIRITT